jgi:hypothetical protein
MGLTTGDCPLNKHLHNMGLDEPICIACMMEDESAFRFLCDKSDISMNAHIFETDSER